jgi:2-polyprenyl-3-methyl-5-hydroxy-6-metoxy-1,4-benzoquinol methylase
MCDHYKTKDVLDYGCGKATLSASLPFYIKCYDPCIEEYSAPPRPADIVVCTDVLEHIEPDYVGAVLDDLMRLTKVLAFLSIASRPAKKTLPDGRNAHLIQERYEWWLPQIWKRFDIMEFMNMSNKEYILVCGPRGTV